MHGPALLTRLSLGIEAAGFPSCNFLRWHTELSCEFLLGIAALCEEVFDEIHAGLLASPVFD